MSRIFRTLIVAGILSIVMTGTALGEEVIIGHYGDPAPVQVAIANGKFEEATGWNIEWRKFDSGAQVIAAMASGDVQISELGSSPLAIATSQGLDLNLALISFVIGKSEALVTREGAGISEPSDLIGKRIAVPIGSTSHLALMGALEHWGIDASEVRIIGMQPNQIYAAWTQDAIDAAFVWYPVQGKLLENGKRLVTAGKVATWGYPTFNGWVVSSDFASENAAEMVAFIETMNAVNERYRNSKESWTAESAPVRKIADRTGASAEQVPAILDGNQYLTAQEQVSEAWLGGGAAKALKTTAEFLESVGRINTATDDYNTFVDASFAEEAAR